MDIRRRLAPDARRAQLIGLGLELVKTRPVDRLLVDDVIRAAGISKGLLFHYFGSKREYRAAVVAAAADEVLAAVDVDPGLAPAEQLRAGLDRFVAYIEQQPRSYAAIARSAGSDELLLEVFRRTRAAIVDRILAVAGTGDGTARLAAAGWVAMAEEATLLWVEEGGCTRDELLALLEHAGAAALAAPVPRR